MDFFSPSHLSLEDALKKASHIGIAAHQDDLEFMCSYAICEARNQQSFFGVIVTNGSSSPRSGAYAKVTNDEMIEIRKRNKRGCQDRGYCGVLQLGLASDSIKTQKNEPLLEQFKSIFEKCHNKTLWTHNLCDRHLSHARVTSHVIEALRGTPKQNHPMALYGCEVWGSLDWLAKGDRVEFGFEADLKWLTQLLSQFPSQSEAGKNYVEAILGRKRANATLSNSHALDRFSFCEIAMDLTPLIRDSSLTTKSYIERLTENSRQEMLSNWKMV